MVLCFPSVGPILLELLPDALAGRSLVDPLDFFYRRDPDPVVVFGPLLDTLLKLVFLELFLINYLFISPKIGASPSGLIDFDFEELFIEKFSLLCRSYFIKVFERFS
jgi:hypothetical protein